MKLHRFALAAFAAAASLMPAAVRTRKMRVLASGAPQHPAIQSAGAAAGNPWARKKAKKSRK